MLENGVEVDVFSFYSLGYRSIMHKKHGMCISVYRWLPDNPSLVCSSPGWFAFADRMFVSLSSDATMLNIFMLGVFLKASGDTECLFLIPTLDRAIFFVLCYSHHEFSWGSFLS